MCSGGLDEFDVQVVQHRALVDVDASGLQLGCKLVEYEVAQAFAFGGVWAVRRRNRLFASLRLI